MRWILTLALRGPSPLVMRNQELMLRPQRDCSGLFSLLPCAELLIKEMTVLLAAAPAIMLLIVL